MFPAEAAGVTAELRPLYQMQTLASALCPIGMKLFSQVHKPVTMFQISLQTCFQIYDLL